VTGLTNGQSYDFRVSATNAAGTGATSSTTTATPATAPDAPTTLAATAGNGQVSLTWVAPVVDGGAAVTDYLVQFSSDGGTTWQTFTDGVSTALTATVTGLANGTTYTFQVAAINAAGTGAFSNTDTATPVTTPGTPTSLAAVATSSTTVDLTWTAPTNGGSALTDYRVEYSADGGATWLFFGNVGSATPSVTVTSLTASTPYHFRVAAINAIGTGAFSAAATASTPP
jgi:large repetitive protein